MKPVSRGWYVLLLLPVVATMWVGSYNQLEPTLLGFPYFYWYQLLWVVLSAGVVGVVYLATHRADE
jgi:hypothetical protein